VLAGKLKDQVMLSMVYVSSITRPLNEEDFTQLLAAARQNNERNDITGLLLYKDGNFMQAVEGPDEAVSTLFDRIRRDSRHHGVLMLLKEQITERRFPNWSMSLKNLNQLEAPQRAQINSFLTDDFTAESYRKNPTSAIKLLLTFRDVVR
jgi:hypothetical protein